MPPVSIDTGGIAILSNRSEARLSKTKHQYLSRYYSQEHR